MLPGPCTPPMEAERVVMHHKADRKTLKPWSLVDYTAVLDGVHILWDDTVCESLLWQVAGHPAAAPATQRSTNRFCRFVTALTTSRVASATS
jgi:hypothetical protein